MSLVEKILPVGARDILQNFTQLMAVGVCQACQYWGMEPRIKWPNDVLVRGKKIAGILCESRFSGSSVLGLVIGVGVNLVHAPVLDEGAKFPSTCFSHWTDPVPSRQEVIEKILSFYFGHYEAFLLNGFQAIYDVYVSFMGYTEGQLYLEHHDPEIAHRYAGLTKSGELVVENPRGERIIVRSGEVQWKR